MINNDTGQLGFHGGSPAHLSPLPVRGNNNAATASPFWNPRSGKFDGPQLRLAIVVRGWTVGEFAEAASVSLACLYNALKGYGVTDKTTIRFFKALSLRRPIVQYTDVSSIL
jgi:hypothetical protein